MKMTKNRKRLCPNLQSIRKMGSPPFSGTGSCFHFSQSPVVMNWWVSLCSNGVTKRQGPWQMLMPPVTVWADLCLWNARWLIMDSQLTGVSLIWHQSPGRCLVPALCLQTHCPDILPLYTHTWRGVHGIWTHWTVTQCDLSWLGNVCIYASEITHWTRSAPWCWSVEEVCFPGSSVTLSFSSLPHWDANERGNPQWRTSQAFL